MAPTSASPGLRCSPATLEASTDHLLVVDDEPHMTTILSRWLGMMGYSCECENGAEGAIRTLERRPFSLVLTDVMMPGRDGLELLAEIRRRFPSVAVLVATALDDRNTAIKAVKLGAYGYLIKPFDHNELLINVAGALERRRLVLESQNYQSRLEREVEERTRAIRQREEDTVWRLVSALEYRDIETGAHIRRIGEYSATLAREMGWSARAIDDLRMAATMHDIGKIGIPDTILHKPGKLTPEEFQIMQQHTIIGATILSGSTVPLLQLAEDIALSHHEKWDGSGYPNRLARREIPESARIVAIADVYDALAHRRVYKEAFPDRQVLAMMREQGGKHFDPTILDLFFAVEPRLRAIREEFRELPAFSRSSGAGDRGF